MGTAKKATPPRVPNGHGYCWAKNPNGPGRCTLPIGHGPGGGDEHHDPYNESRWRDRSAS